MTAIPLMYSTVVAFIRFWAASNRP
jgi:hypothetical protein